MRLIYVTTAHFICHVYSFIEIHVCIFGRYKIYNPLNLNYDHKSLVKWTPYQLRCDNNCRAQMLRHPGPCKHPIKQPRDYHGGHLQTTILRALPWLKVSGITQNSSGRSFHVFAWWWAQVGLDISMSPNRLQAIIKTNDDPVPRPLYYCRWFSFNNFYSF